jgi:RNA polymerase sigma factor
MAPLLKRKVASNESNEINQTLALAKAGDITARERLLVNYRPFVLRVASSVTHRYINPEQDDEFSVALIAYDEAISSYRSERGGSFLAFAEMVIRRRLLDYFRRQSRTQNELPMSGMYSEDEEEEPGFAIYGAQQQYQVDTETEDRCLELEEFQSVLADYGIELSQLVASAPKHCDTRRYLMELADTLSRNDTFRNALEKNRDLPYRQVAEEYGITVKTLRRHRAYLIAIFLIKTGDYPLLKNYVNG